MNRRNRNLSISLGVFILGAIFVLSDSASINANVVGASDTSAGIASIVGLIMIITAVGLFAVSIQHRHDDTELEQLVRGNKSKTYIKPEDSDNKYEEITKEHKQ